MSIVTVVAKLVAKPDAVETVKQELIRLVEPTRCEEGCIEYILHQDNANPAVFVFYEDWDSEECLAKHKETPHYKACFGAIADKLADREVHLMSMLEA